MEIRNSIHKAISTQLNEVKSGVGLKNVKERLLLLYPEKSELKVTENDQEFQVNLNIQL
jgi:sensor histidine kinase YesM